MSEEVSEGVKEGAEGDSKNKPHSDVGNNS